MQGKAVRLVCVIGMFVWAVAWMIACGINEPPLESGGGPGTPPAVDGGSCASPHEGCPCSNGDTLACGSVISTNGSYTTCSQGTMTCVGSAWGPCQGKTIVQRGKESITLGPGGHYGIIPMYTPTPCGDAQVSDVCDPNPGCTVIGGSSSDVDAAGVFPTSGGGVSLNPDAGLGSTPSCIDGGLQCNIVYCGSGSDAGTTLSGTVTDPAGINPLYGIYVYIPEYAGAALTTFSSGVACENANSCTSGIHAVTATQTAADGTFKLTNVPSGSNVPIVVQSGKWRREILLASAAITQCTGNTVSSSSCVLDGGMTAANCTLRLPQSHTDGWDPVAATYTKADMPQMALVSGSADPLECVLMKAGISTSEISSYDVNPAAKLHFFESDTAPGSTLDSHFGNPQKGSKLWVGDAGTVLPGMYDYYDVVLFPCEGAAIDKESLKGTSAGSNTEPYNNLIQYTDLGGRAFITHYGYVWLEYPSSKSYVTGDNWAHLATWTSSPSTQSTTFTQDPMTAYVDTTLTLGGSFTKGVAFSSWLYGTGASVDAGQIILHEARQDLTTVENTTNNVQVWMTATDSYPPYGVPGSYDPHFTFQTPIDAGSSSTCGQVVYSDFHVAASALVSGSASCQSNATCGYGQTCVGGSLGGTGTCQEPCATAGDCHDSTYKCQGATAGTCQPLSCVPGTYVCSLGACYMPSTTPIDCVCTNDNQCSSLKCVNSNSMCTGTNCTGDAAAGTTAPNCQTDSITGCDAAVTYTCSDSHYSCDAGSGTCNGITTGTMPAPVTDGGFSLVDAGTVWSARTTGSTCGPGTSAASPEFYTGSASVPTTAASGFSPITPTLSVAHGGGTSSVLTIGAGGTAVPWPSIVSVQLTSQPNGVVYAIYKNNVLNYYQCFLANNKDACDLPIMSAADYIQVVLSNSGSDSVNLNVSVATCPSATVLAEDVVETDMSSGNTLPLGCNVSGSGGTCLSSAANESSSYAGKSSATFPALCYGCNSTCAGSGGACDTVYVLDAGGGGAGACCEYSACSPYDAGSGACGQLACDAGTLNPSISATDAGYSLGGAEINANAGWVQVLSTTTFTAGTVVAFTVGSISVSNSSHVGDAVEAAIVPSGGTASPSCTSSYYQGGTYDINTCVIVATASTLYEFNAETGHSGSDNYFPVTLQEFTCPSGYTAEINGSSATTFWSASTAGVTNGSLPAITCVAIGKCGVPNDAGTTCATGTPNDAGTECLCTADNQCPNGVCVTWSGCTDGGCTGAADAGADLNHCATASIPQCSIASDVFTCGLAGGGGCIDAGTGAANCHCNSDTQCTASGSKCAYWSGCDGGCTGSDAGTTNDFGCTVPGAVFGTSSVGCTASVYSCTSPAVCNDAGTYCWCTQDSECPSGQCVTWSGCDGGCTGTGSQTPDNAHCVAATDAGISCTSNSSCGVSSTQVEFCAGAGDGGANLGLCEKLDGAVPTCTSASQCLDQSYPVACIGGSDASWGTCCDSWNTSNCGLNNRVFPEACLQAPMTAQEKALEFMFFDLTACITQDQYDGGASSASILLSPETFSLDFQATCPLGQQARWREFDYQATFPTTATGSSIKFAAQTGQIGADAGSYLPASPLTLLTTSTTVTGSTWGAIIIDTSPGGDGGFTVDGVVSQDDLRMWITLTPTTDQLQSPVLATWSAKYDCAATE